MKRITLSIYCTLVWLGCATGSAQVSVQLFPDSISSLALEPSGKIVVAYWSAAVRLNEQGNIETTFQRTGSGLNLGVETDLSLLASGSKLKRYNGAGVEVFQFPGSVYSFLLQPDGKVIVWEKLSQSLVRRNPDGTSDPSFSSAQLPPGAGLQSRYGLALQEDGKILVGPSDDGIIRRFNADGSPDTGFHALALSAPTVNTLLVQPDGKILIGGWFQKIGDVARHGLARLNSDGSLDSAFNPSSENWTGISSLALQANGKFVVSGQFIAIDGQLATNVVRLTREGRLDSSFPVTTLERMGYFLPLALQQDGTVLIGIETNLVRITNPDPAEQRLTREGSRLTWLRSGSSPEIFHARFQYSQDGIQWNDLGAGKRMSGGWQLEGADIPAGARLRARGYVTGTSYYLDQLEDAAVGLKLEPPTYDPAVGQIVLKASAPAETPALLQISTDLKEWSTVQTNRVGSNLTQIHLTNPSSPGAFYRLLQTND